MPAVALVLAAGASWEPAALSVLDGKPGVVVLKRCVDVDDLLAAAAAGQADVAVLSVDAPGLDASAVARLRHHGVRAVAVVPAGGEADAARTRAARAGIARCVTDADLAALPAALTATDEEAADPQPEPQEPAWPAPDGAAGGRVLAVWGPAGAPGRTTVATALAAELARRRVDTVLVDADPYGGAVAQTLGVLDEVSGLLAAARLAGTGELPGRLATVMRALAPQLGLVSGLPRADRWPEVRPGVLSELLDVARGVGQVVVDTGFCLEEDPAAELGVRAGRNQLTLDALDAADAIVVVGAADPVGLARLAHGLGELRDRGVGAPVHVVVNRVRPTLGWRERDITEVAATVSKMIQPAALHLLPDDRLAVDRALASGRTIQEAAPDTALVRAIARVADGFVRAPGARRASRGRPARGRWLRARAAVQA